MALPLAPVVIREASPPIQGKELAFNVPLGQGAVVFKERPLVVDAALAVSVAVGKERYNSRHSWSITEECLKTIPGPELEALVSKGGYADGIGLVKWEVPGDDNALEYLVRTYKKPGDLIRRLYDIMSTNVIIADTGLMAMEDGQGHRFHVPYPRYGFFPLLSRANHSCTPSATLVRPPTEPGVTHVVTTRPVKEGDALTIDYVQAEPLETKRTFLLENYDFRCACERCRDFCSRLSCNNAGTKVCSACKQMRYCCREHQVADWPRHKMFDCTVKK